MARYSKKDQGKREKKEDQNEQKEVLECSASSFQEPKEVVHEVIEEEPQLACQEFRFWQNKTEHSEAEQKEEVSCVEVKKKRRKRKTE